MADTRTLKLSLLADVNKFLAGMDKADKGTKTFSTSIGKYSKAMATSFAVAGAAAGAYAIKLGVDAVKAAVEDEISQKKLAKALQNTTGATDDQIKATEDYIKKTQLRFGVSDVKLRASLGNLARATGDVTEAQKLNGLALDISAATGKDLETVSLALSKGYGGNLGALTKLGVPLDANIIKTKDFEGATDKLQKLFGGAAAANTETLQGKMAILSETFGELKEDVGARMLDPLKRLMDRVKEVAAAFSGDDPEGLTARARELQGISGDTSSGSLGRSLNILADSFKTLFSAFAGDTSGTTDSMQNMANALNNLAGAINAFASAYGKLDKFIKSPGYQKTLDAIFGTKKGGFSTSVLNPFGTNFLGAGAITGARAAGGSVMGGRPYKVGEFGSEIFVPAGSGSIRKASGSGDGVTIVINGAVDANGTRRQLEQLFRTSSRQMGLVNLNGARL